MAGVLLDCDASFQGRGALRRIVGLYVFVGLFLSASVSMAATSSWEFVDVTEAAGLIYEHGYVQGPNTEIQRMASGVAAADYDGDGWVDLYVVRGDIGPNLLFRNLHNGTFEEVGAELGVDLPGAVSSGPVFADFDGDGWLDLFVGGIDGTPPTLFRSQRGESFEDITSESGIAYSGNTLSATCGDYDHDGDLDLFLSHWGEPSDGTGHLWRNDGTARFVDADASAGMPNLMGLFDWTFSPNFADVNNDGWVDLLVAADFNTSEVYLNNRNGTFTSLGIGPLDTDENGMGAAIGDYDNDGDLDWFVASIWDGDADPEGNWGVTGNRLYQNHGNGRFDDVTDQAGVRQGDWGWGSTFGDFNNDGHLDLFHVNGWRWPPFSTDPARLFVSNGDGTFAEQGVLRGAASQGQGRGVACFDFDRDGDLDLFIANNSAAPLLLRNDGGNTSNYLTVRLVGEAPNPLAVGSRLYARVGSTTQMRELRIGCNFVSQNPLEVHFGLGTATQIDELRILWPDGTRNTLTNVAANQLLEVHQNAVPVLLSDLNAVADADGVLLTWRLAPQGRAEYGGVSVQRAISSEGPFTDVSFDRLEPASYMSFLDVPVAAVSEYWYRIVLHPRNGVMQVAGTLRVAVGLSLGGTKLFQPATPVGDQPLEIRYRIGQATTQAQLTLYDARGRRMQTLASGQHRSGLYVLTWDRGQSEQALAAGIYFLHLRAGGVVASRKIVLLSP